MKFMKNFSPFTLNIDGEGGKEGIFKVSEL